MIIKIIILIFIIFVLGKIFLRYQKKEISRRELLIWLIFWLLVAGAVVWPHQTDVFSKFFGVERGADLLVYISILVLFYLVFRILVKLERIDKEITKIIRHIALDENSKDKHSE